jgi:hypothetical protein
MLAVMSCSRKNAMTAFYMVPLRLLFSFPGASADVPEEHF